MLQCDEHQAAIEGLQAEVRGMRADFGERLSYIDGQLAVLVTRATKRPGPAWVPSAKTIGAIVGALGAAVTAWAAAKGWL